MEPIDPKVLETTLLRGMAGTGGQFRARRDACDTLIADYAQNQRESRRKLTSHDADLDKRIAPAAFCIDAVPATDPDGPLHLAPSCTCID